jgi:hypothetical protein
MGNIIQYDTGPQAGKSSHALNFTLFYQFTQFFTVFLKSYFSPVPTLVVQNDNHFSILQVHCIFGTLTFDQLRTVHCYSDLIFEFISGSKLKK